MPVLEASDIDLEAAISAFSTIGKESLFMALSTLDAARPIVIDIGGFGTRAGLAGDATPSVNQPTVVLSDGTVGNVDVGDVDLGVRFPIGENGLVEDWEAMEAVLRHVTSIFRGEGGDGEDEVVSRAVVVGEGVLEARADRSRWMEFLVERLGCPGVFFAKQAVLSAYAHARTGGLVVDLGYSGTSVLPVQEGFPLIMGLRHSPVGLGVLDRFGNGGNGRREKSMRLRDFQKVLHHASVRESSLSVSSTLPDGERILSPSEKLGELWFDAEPLFETFPSSANLPKMLVDALMASDPDIRTILSAQTILVGGAAHTPNLASRIHDEFETMAPIGTAIEYVGSDKSQTAIAPFIGGSIVGSLDTFRELYITKAQWQEHGIEGLLDKCP